MGYQAGNRTADNVGSQSRKMSTFSFILPSLSVVVCLALADNSDIGPQGIGTFAYRGGPIVVSNSQAVVVAGRSSAANINKCKGRGGSMVFSYERGGNGRIRYSGCAGPSRGSFAKSF